MPNLSKPTTTKKPKSQTAPKTKKASKPKPLSAYVSTYIIHPDGTGSVFLKDGRDFYYEMPRPALRPDSPEFEAHLAKFVTLSSEKMYDVDDLIPGDAHHPCETLRQELKARKIKKKDFAAMLKMPPTVVRALLKGECSITPEMAVKLEAALEISAEFWLRMQVGYEIDLVRIKHRDEIKNAALPAKRKKRLVSAISKR